MELRTTSRTTLSSIIGGLEVDQFTTVESRLVNGGSLQVRRLASGDAAWYWRATKDGKTFRERIGVVDLKAPPKALQPTRNGYGLAAAREACRTLAEDHKGHAGGLQGLKADEKEQEAAKRRDREERGERSLEALLKTYVEHLRRQGRSSAVDAANIFALHVVKAFPKLATKAAAELSLEDCVDMQRRLLELGHGRTANKLRAYLRAAFQCALDVRVDASLPAAFRGFKVAANPAALTKRAAGADRADKHPLTLDEMRTYWQRIRDLDGLPGAALRLHLLLGAPRIDQLLRLRVSDVREDALILYDLKGRPGLGPRPQVLPITDPVRQALGALSMSDTFALSTTGGEKPISNRTFAAYAHGAVADALAAFTPKRLRSGVETLLAEHGVSRDTRAALQSHGQGGIQQRHYDASDQLPAKRAALTLLYDLLTRKDANVVPIRQRGRASA